MLAACLTLGPLPRRLFLATTSAAQDVAVQVGLNPLVVSRPRVDAAANVVLFVPLGFLLARALPRVPPLAVVALCSAASAAVELAQALVLDGRYATARDVLMNTTGAALGVALAYARRARTS